MNLLQINLQDFDPDIAREFGGGATGMDFLGVPLFDAQSLWTTLIRFVFNFLVCWAIIHFFYYKKANRKDYYFTFIMFAVVIFLIISLMENMKMNIAYALGLFAIFGMIRYRTETVPIREMNYMFLIIALSVINSLSLKADGLAWYLLLFANILMLALAWGFELWNGRKRQSTKIVLYEKIENIKPENREALIADLQERTGLKVVDVEIGHIDFLRDVADIKMTDPLEKGKTVNSIDLITKFK